MMLPTKETIEGMLQMLPKRVQGDCRLLIFRASGLWQAESASCSLPAMIVELACARASRRGHILKRIEACSRSGV